MENAVSGFPLRKWRLSTSKLLSGLLLSLTCLSKGQGITNLCIRRRQLLSQLWPERQPEAAPGIPATRKGKHQGSQHLRGGGANDINDGDYCDSRPQRGGCAGAASCAPQPGRLRAVSHTCSGAQLCESSSHRFQGEQRCFSGVTKRASRLVLLSAGHRSAARLQPSPCQRQGAEDALDPSPSPPHSPVSYDAAEKRKKKRKKNLVFNLSDLDQTSAQTKVK